MKIRLRAKTLEYVVRRAHLVASRATAGDSDLAGRITVEASPNRVLFLSANDGLEVRLSLLPGDDPYLTELSPGQATVESHVFWKLAREFASEGKGDHPIDVSVDGDWLRLEDRAAGQQARIGMRRRHHKLRQEVRCGVRKTLLADVLRRGIGATGRYISHVAYKKRYHSILLDFVSDEIRFVCGDGMRFAVNSYPMENSEECRVLLHIGQARLMAELLQGSTHVECMLSDERFVLSPDDGITEIVLRRPSGMTYIEYQRHAYQTDRACCIIDVRKEDFQRAVAQAEAVRDADAEKKGGFLHTVRFDASDLGLNLSVTEGRSLCDTTIPANFYSLDGTKRFLSDYAWDYLKDVATSACGSHLRFFAIGTSSTIIVDLCDLRGPTNALVPPETIETDDGERLRFFFAPNLPDDED